MATWDVGQTNPAWGTHCGVGLALSTQAQAQRFEAIGEYLFPPKDLVHNFRGCLDA